MKSMATASSEEDSSISDLRLTLMQDVLPVSLALLERARSNGPRGLVEAFTTSSTGDPLGDLRREGEPAASSLREQLDRVSPGLGNPIMPVVVEVDNGSSTADLVSNPAVDQEELQGVLTRIDEHLQLLKEFLDCPQKV